MIEAQGRIYHHTGQHICPINTDMPTPITRLSIHQDCPITRPGSRKQPQSDDPPQQDPAKPSKHSCSPRLPCTAMPNNCYAAHECSYHPSASCIPNPCCNPFSRPFNHSASPFPRPTNPSAGPFPRPLAPTPPIVDQYLAHLTAINDSPAVQQEADDLIPESMPYFLASFKCSEPTSNSKKSTNSNPDENSDTQSTSSETSTQSTASNRKLRQHIPINYNETLLTCLHGQSQI